MPLGRTRNARVIQQMALAVLVAREQEIRQPAHLRFLVPSRLRLQQLPPCSTPRTDPASRPVVSNCSNTSTAADALFVPVQAAGEIIPSALTP